MTKTVQMYNLHLINGDVIPVPEDFDLTGKKTLLYWFSHEDVNEILKVGNQFLGFCYVPKKTWCISAPGMSRNRSVFPMR